ncbi:Sodium:potassium:calcium exchanger [Fasciolopsis buskii]|uniref:Sodium:potassium:calcium exchanger n=1 Tax=Fasciolopsis buskii TaxID=27845 RepID=A0A8E0VNE8_9TREM|nr:Sodium:potassium:calcium exchanger [Fasciolopsis buski]
MFFKRRSSLHWRLGCILLYLLLLSVKTYFYHEFRNKAVDSYKLDELGQQYVESASLSTMGFQRQRHLLGINIIHPGPTANCTPLAMENFPKDLFTQKQRQRGAVILHIVAAVYMFIALAILCDEYFIPCLERICEVLHLQPDVAGATFMAAGSSAPELATTLVGVFIAKDDIGLGAVVGSADFNIMLVVSVTALFAKQIIYLNWWPLVRDCAFYLISIVVLALVIVDENIYWYEAMILLLLYTVYVIFMYYNPRCDAFWNAWCRQHPTCCPRAIHTEQEELDYMQQHSGAFGHVTGQTQTPGFPSALPPEQGYTRLSSDKMNDPYLSTGDVNDSGIACEKLRANSITLKTDEFEAQVISADANESWSETCLSPLRLPGHGSLRGKVHYACCVCLLPIRLVLCLTIPDVRKAKWRQIFVSHWIAFFMACVWIGLFTVIMMWMITVIGVTFHIPDTIMGLTFIAAGSSVPDAIASILVVREGEGDMAVSNAVGSNVFDILVCMGLPWFLKCIISGAPVIIYSKGLLYATLTLFSTVLFLLGVTHLNRWRLTKPYGVVLLIGYIVVLIFCSCYELNLFSNVHPPACPLIE